MPKPSLIKLEFLHIPQQHFGAFWLFCEEHPGIQFKHQTPAQSQLPAKRANGKKAEGTTGKCIVLTALKNHPQLTYAEMVKMIVEHGKSPKSLGNVLHELKGDKQIRQSKLGGYSIVAPGLAYLKANCPNKAKE